MKFDQSHIAVAAMSAFIGGALTIGATDFIQKSQDQRDAEAGKAVAMMLFTTPHPDSQGRFEAMLKQYAPPPFWMRCDLI